MVLTMKEAGSRPGDGDVGEERGGMPAPSSRQQRGPDGEVERVVQGAWHYRNAFTS